MNTYIYIYLYIYLYTCSVPGWRPPDLPIYVGGSSAPFLPDAFFQITIKTCLGSRAGVNFSAHMSVSLEKRSGFGLKGVCRFIFNDNL